MHIHAYLHSTLMQLHSRKSTIVADLKVQSKDQANRRARLHYATARDVALCGLYQGVLIYGR
jgi:hypothetical protein